MSDEQDNNSGESQDKGLRHMGPDHTSPYPVSRLATAFEPVDVSKELAEADSHLNTRVSAKLQVLADQIRSLQEEARKTLEEAQEDHDLHRAKCHFHRKPGHTYHLYEKADGSRYFSMVSPREWGGNHPDTYVNSYVLNQDMSWTPADQVGKAEESREMVAKLLESSGPSSGSAE